MSHKKTNQSAFTLIDILVSVAIVSFLSSVVLFNVSEGRVRAQDAKMKVESAQVATAIEIFKVSNDGKTPIFVKAQYFYPIVPGKMYQEGTEEYTTIMNDLITDGYIPKIPTSPDGTSYAYGESTDGTQAVFYAKLKSEKSALTNTRNSCDIIEPSVTSQKELCYQGFIPIASYAPLLIECSYIKPQLVSEDLPGPTYTVTVAEPANWDCSEVPLNIAEYTCSLLDEGGAFEEGCDVQGYTWEFEDGVFAKLCSIVPSPNKSYICSRSYDNPPPCFSVLLEDGYTCTNISETIYEVCPIDQDEDENLCDGSDNSDYCTCI